MNEEIVRIHGSDWKKSDLIDAIHTCQKEKWEPTVWKPRPALIQKSGGGASLYLGQRFDPLKYDLVADGWNHDHCLICWWELFEGGSEDQSQGYFNGQSYLCAECFERFIKVQAGD